MKNCNCEEPYEYFPLPNGGIHCQKCNLPIKVEYNTDELQAKFNVIGFGYGYVAVEDKITKQKGSFDFGGSPRIYFDYKPS